MQRSDVIKKKVQQTNKKTEAYLHVLFMWISFISYLIHVYANTLLIYALFLCQHAITSTMTSYSFERSDTLYFMDDEFFLWNDLHLDRVRDVLPADPTEFWQSYDNVEPKEYVLIEYGVQLNGSLTFRESALASPLFTLINKGEKLPLLER